MAMHTYGDDRGFSFMSVFDHVGDVPGQVNASWMYPGVVKAWHRHALQEDHWTVLSGMLKIGLFNSETEPLFAELRLAHATPGKDDPQRIEIPPHSGRAVHLGEHRAGVLRIPKRIWHGGVAVGNEPALLLYYVTRKYDPRNPDEERAPWDGFAFSWQPEFR